MPHIISLDYLYIKEILSWMRNEIQQEKGETRKAVNDRREGIKTVKSCQTQTCGKEIVSAVFFS